MVMPISSRHGSRRLAVDPINSPNHHAGSVRVIGNNFNWTQAKGVLRLMTGDCRSGNSARQPSSFRRSPRCSKGIATENRSPSRFFTLGHSAEGDPYQPDGFTWQVSNQKGSGHHDHDLQHVNDVDACSSMESHIAPCVRHHRVDHRFLFVSGIVWVLATSFPAQRCDSIP